MSKRKWQLVGLAALAVILFLWWRKRQAQKAAADAFIGPRVS